MAEDLDAEACHLEHELRLLEEQHEAFLERLDEPWNELRAIGGLPREDLRKSLGHASGPADSTS